MITRKLFIFILIPIVLFSSCKTLKSLSSEKNKKESVKKIITKSQINVISLKANYSANIRFYEHKINTIGIINIISDDSAGISVNSTFGLPLAKILLNKDSILLKSTFTKNLSIKTSMLDSYFLSFSPKTLKDLLLANFITINDTINIERYSIRFENDTIVVLNYKIKNKTLEQFSDFNNSITFSLTQRKILLNSFWYGAADTQVLIKYSAFKEFKNYIIPTKIHIQLIKSLDTLLNTNIKIKKVQIR